MKKVLITLFILLGIFFRLYNIGYSNFQGDEVEAQNYLFDERPFHEFLLTRPKGPGQYVVSFLMNNIATLIHISDRLEWFIRLPFISIGVLSLLLFSYISIKLFGVNKSLFNIFFFSFSGLLIAFSRIVQYQSFVIFFLLLVFLLVKKNKIVLSGIVCSVGLLFHWDMLSFIIPIVFLLIQNRISLIKFVFPIVLICGLYYLPFILNKEFRDNTASYLFQERLVEEDKFDSVYYSGQVLTFYHSREMLVFLVSLLILYLLNFNNSSRNSKMLFTLFLINLILRLFTVETNIYLRVSSLVLFTLLVISNHKRIYDNENRLLIYWLAFSFFMYILLMSKPLTHIYVVLVPLFLSLGILKIPNYLKKGFLIMLFVSFISVVSFLHQAFIDVQPEYPWNSKSYVFGQMKDIKGKPGIFGFPYYRELEKLNLQLVSYNGLKYTSNEKYRLLKYYIRDLKYDGTNPDIMISIKNPQSNISTPQENIVEISKLN